eukprot:9951412-Alexandrium_andersonii.AAC.1
MNEWRSTTSTHQAWHATSRINTTLPRCLAGEQAQAQTMQKCLATERTPTDAMHMAAAPRRSARCLHDAATWPCNGDRSTVSSAKARKERQRPRTQRGSKQSTHPQG